MKYTILLSSLALLGLAACAPQAELPKTPEEVVKAYQAYYDQNRFEEAKALSTLAEQKRLDELAKMMREQSPDSTELTTVFLSLKCRTKGDSAFCNCRCKDQYETYTTDFVLLRRKKQWYIDAPKEEQYQFDEEDYEGVVDTLFHLLDVEQ
jgi:hypothetical protein